jgi:enoyl-CoA hydratase/carnithine racemase
MAYLFLYCNSFATASGSGSNAASAAVVGLKLAVRADVIIAAETARFGHPEQSLAIITVLGGIYRVAKRAGRSKAIERALTSEQVSARVMEQYGCRTPI